MATNRSRIGSTVFATRLLRREFVFVCDKSRRAISVTAKQSPKASASFGRHRQTVDVLLCGGDKRTQTNDVKRAKLFWADWKGWQ